MTTDIGDEDALRVLRRVRRGGRPRGDHRRVAARDGVWGVLGAHARAPRQFASDEADFLRAVANVISSAVDRNRVDEEVRHRAMHDPLTGLPNRALALDRLEGALARRRRDGRAVAVLLADLDQFKLVNDSMGHQRRRRPARRARPAAARRGPPVRHRRAARRRRVPGRVRAARRPARGDPRGRARRAGDQPADRAGRRRALHHRQHRDRGRRDRRRRSRRPAARRRRRDVPGEGARPRPLRAVRRRAAQARAQPDAHGERAAPRDRAGRAAGRLPAGRRRSRTAR